MPCYLLRRRVDNSAIASFPQLVVKDWADPSPKVDRSARQSLPVRLKQPGMLQQTGNPALNVVGCALSDSRRKLSPICSGMESYSQPTVACHNLRTVNATERTAQNLYPRAFHENFIWTQPQLYKLPQVPVVCAPTTRAHERNTRSLMTSLCLTCQPHIGTQMSESLTSCIGSSV